MSSAIDFAVRTQAGGTTYGNVAAPGESTFVQTGLGDTISLNISSQSVIGYTQQGNDLLIELADGRIITLADWFVAPGETPNRLYLSTDGTMTEVMLADAGNGQLIPSYSLAVGGEKWSPLDDLRFGDSDPVVALAGTGQDEPAGMGIFVPGLLGLGGAGLAGAALVGGGLIIGGGGGGGGGTQHQRTIDGSGTTTTITTNTNQPAINVTGTGIPGDSVRVTVGNREQTATVQPDGKWNVSFTGANLPSDGTHTATAVFTGGGNTTTLTGGGFIIDMTPPNVAATEGTQSTGDIENLVEYRDGVTLRGTSEAGATVTVTLGTPGTPGAITRNAEMNADGTWSITFTPQEIAGGERTQTVTIVATDRLGNVGTPLTEVIVLDTIAPPVSIGRVADDDIVNRIESQSQVLIGGTGVPNSTIQLQISGMQGAVTVNVNGEGRWSHAIAAGTLTDGSYDVTAIARDAAENETIQRSSFRVDTQMSVGINAGFAGDDVVNLRDSQGALTLTGTVPADATRVEVQWLGQTFPATLNGNGTWSMQFPAGIASTSQMSEIRVTAWDAANNSHSATRPVRIDLETALGVEQFPVGNDQILSGAEQSAGFTLDGEGEAGARIFLNLNGRDYGPATVGDNGRWAFTFTGADLQGLTHGQQATITAYAIDAAGNRSAGPDPTRTFTVDTQVGNFTFAAPDLQLGQTPDSPRDATVLNATERSAGLPIQGTVEPGATVTIRVAETNWSTTIPASQTQAGTWTFTLPADALPQGAAQTATIIATATDAQGNTSPQQERIIAIDTVVANFAAADIRVNTGTDNILNAREHALGLPVEGRAEVGSTVAVTMNGHTEYATTNSLGRWSVNFTPDQIPEGEVRNVMVSVTATDTAGNVSGPFTQTFDIDTIAPSTPTVIAAEDVAGGYRAITTTNTNDIYTFSRVDATGAAQSVSAQESQTFRREDRFDFATDIPDGSYLVINTRDLAGNEANTLFIKNTATGVSVDLTREGLANFDLSAIDLTRAPDARLTISAQQLEALTGPDQQLIVKGESTDQVTLRNVTREEHNVRDAVTGQVYDIYTLGDSGARILLEDDVSRTVL